MSTKNRIDWADSILDASANLSNTIRASITEVETRYSAGEIGEADLLEIHEFFAEQFDKRKIVWRGVWNEILPGTIDLRYILRYKKNCKCGVWGENEHWCGTIPLEHQIRPANGTNLVYALFDSENKLCYIGSTNDFKTRISDHRKTKPFVSWSALEFETREDAYVTEDRLIKQHKPYLNVRLGR